MDLNNLKLDLEDAISQEYSSEHNTKIKLVDITIPTTQNLQQWKPHLSEEECLQAIANFTAYRVTFDGIETVHGPQYDWFKLCFAQKRIDWQDAQRDVDLLIRKLAETKFENLFFHEDRHSDVHHAQTSMNDKNPYREYHFTSTITRKYDVLGDFRVDEDPFKEMLIHNVRRSIRRKRNEVRSYMNHVNDGVRYIHNELTRGRPSNRNLYNYVQDYLPRSYHATSRFIIGREMPDLEPENKEDVKFGSHADSYPAYECEGRPR
tara:strand:- start:106 stop:894 length:789 start_codon:yes stop_codon:yes gene_type:complete